MSVRNRKIIPVLLAVGAVLLLVQQGAVSNAAQPFPSTNTPRPSSTPLPPTETLAVTLTPSLVPTSTPTFTLTPTATPSYTATPSHTPSRTATNTPSYTPSRTPTFTRTPEPTLVIMGTYETPVNTPFTAIPYAMPTPVPSGDDVLTVLLLGSDTTFSEIAARTDVIIAVAINRTRGTVSMLHFPRDLLVYVPNHTMAKINTVFQLGNQRYGAGGGAWLMKEMMRYNFGLRIDFYARVDFNRFQEIIRQLDGLEISVDCAVQGNRLISPDLDPELPESYEVYTLNIGLHRLDPYMALWYVRARGSSSDIDRGRRQMEVLRAIWRQARGAGLLAQATVLWPEVQRIVETDMSLTDILGLAPLALSIDPANIQRLTLRQNVHFTEWYTADTGSFVWLPEREAWQETIQNFVLPPPRNRLGGESPTVEIGVSRALQGYDQVAADRLAWEGYSVRLTGTDGVPTLEDTVIYDYTGGAKPNSLDALRRVLRLTPANIINQPDPNATVDFRIEMGRSYGRSCMFSLPSQ